MLLVVLYHLDIGSFNSGFLGVDVFFVISGFLMAALYDENKKLEFFRKRALRLLPAYFVTVIITIAVSIIWVAPGEYGQVLNQSIFADIFASNIGFWMQNSYFSRAEFNPLLHLWSLGVEIQYYLVIPILFLFLKKNRLFFVVMALASLLACFAVVEVSPKTSFFMMPLRLWEFLVGYGVVKYFSENGNVRRSSFGYVGTIALFVIFAIPLFKVSQSSSFISGHPGLYALFIVIATAAVLVFGIHPSLEKSIGGDLLESLGKYSYSIYLVHFPVIVLYLYEPFDGTQLYVDNVLDLAIILFVVVTLSYGMFHGVETALRKSSKIYSILALSPFLIFGGAFLGPVIQKQFYTANDMLVFDAFKDRAPYRCGKVFRVLNPTAISCRLTDSMEEVRQTILLVGNSHADSIKSTFASVANERNADVFFMVSNSPLMGESKIDNSRLLEEAVKRGANSIVLHYSPGALPLSKIVDLTKLAEKKNIFVAFLMPVPTWNAHIPKALWKHLSENEQLPSQELSDYEIRNQELVDFFTKTKLNNLAHYNVADYFCDIKCAITDNVGAPLYFDEGHLTLTGSRRLVPLFEAVISDCQVFRK